MYVEINFIVVQSSFLNSHLVEVDAGVDSRFGLVALQVGFHRLLAHAHGGKHLSDLLQTRRQRDLQRTRRHTADHGAPAGGASGLTGSSLWFSGSSAVSLSRPS